MLASDLVPQLPVFFSESLSYGVNTLNVEVKQRIARSDRSSLELPLLKMQRPVDLLYWLLAALLLAAPNGVCGKCKFDSAQLRNV